MAHKKENDNGFAVCLKNEGYLLSLEKHKIYRILTDPEAEKNGELRIIDESGEDYLYPEDWFAKIEVPKSVETSLLRTA